MLGLLDIAAAESGYRTEITWFEDGEFDGAIDDRPVARVRLIEGALLAPAPLFRHIPTRRTVKDAYDAERMPEPGFASDLERLADGEGLSMRVLSRDASPALAGDVADLVKRAGRSSC